MITRSLQKYLFFPILTTLFATGFLFSLYFSLYISFNVRESSEDTVRRTGEAAVLYLDRTVSDMNRLSVNLTFSDQITADFTRFMNTDDENEKTLLRFQIAHSIERFIGPLYPSYQINIYDHDGDPIGGGYYNLFYLEGYKPPYWLEKAFKAEGQRILNPPELNRWFDTPEKTISLCRSFYDSNFNWLGYIDRSAAENSCSV